MAFAFRAMSSMTGDAVGDEAFVLLPVPASALGACTAAGVGVGAEVVDVGGAAPAGTGAAAVVIGAGVDRNWTRNGCLAAPGSAMEICLWHVGTWGRRVKMCNVDRGKERS